MASVKITGGAQLHVVSAKFLREAGGGLDRDLTKALERVSVPLRKDAKASALKHLPHAGGLNVIVAESLMYIKHRAGGITIAARGMTQLAKTNAGQVRHPVYGRDAWVNQEIPLARDWFFKPMHDGAPKISRELKEALDDVASRIA